MATPFLAPAIDWVDRNRCLCGSRREEWSVVATVRGRPDVTVMKCRACGLGLSTPYPSEATVGELYRDKHAVDDTNFEHVGDTIMDRLKNLVGRYQIRSAVPRGTIRRALDFGAGNGRFALLLREVFPTADVDAVDYQQDPPVVLEGRDGIRYMDVEDWSSGSEFYDAMLLRHVLEHNHDPVALLRTLAGRLAPDGRLYVEVPNLDSWYVGGLGRRVNTLGVPFHLFHFNARTLRAAVNAAGMDCTIGGSEMPLMGTSLAMLAGRPKTLAFQLAGVALQPVQLGLSAAFGKPCVTAVCWR